MHPALRIANAPIAKRRSNTGSGKTSSARDERATDHQHGQSRSQTPIGRSARISRSQGLSFWGAKRSTQFLRGASAIGLGEVTGVSELLFASGQVAGISRSFERGFPRHENNANTMLKLGDCPMSSPQNGVERNG